MTKPLSIDLRERLIAAAVGGLSRRSAAKRFGVAPSSAIKWVSQWRRTGDVRPPNRGNVKVLNAGIDTIARPIRRIGQAVPSAVLADIRAKLTVLTGIM